MNPRLFLKYYLDVSFYNLCFSVLIAFIFSVFWGLLVFATLGNLIAFLCFQLIQKQQYYVYFNAGYTKLGLALKVLAVNAVLMASPLLLMSF